MLTRFIGDKIGDQFLYPPNQPFPKTPADYGYEYKEVEFPAHDGLMLSGWLLNEQADRVIIMTHFGYRANRFGYQTKHQGLIKPYNKEIEFVKVAGRLVDAGYAVLMYDMRNHGISEKTPKGCGTGGIDEANDVLGAVSFVASHKTTKGKPIGLLSYCMGANATFFAYGMHAKLFKRANVKALVAMQPLTNGDYLRSLKFPQAIYDAANTHFKKQTGYKLDAPVLKNVKCAAVPTLLCQGRKDPNTNLDFITSVFAALPAKKEMYWMEEPTHRFDGYNWFYDHPEKMLEWFSKYVK